MALTPKQQRFVEEYLVDLNATAAYKRAGYAAKGNSAEVNAARLLRNAQVQAAVTEAQEQRSEETGITAAWVLEQAAQVYEEARSDGDRKNALKALEMCGKHVDVSAFKEGAGATVNVHIAPGLAQFYGGDDVDGGNETDA